MPDAWLKGNKAIMEFLGIKNMCVLRKWKNILGLPIHHLPSGRSVAIPAELTAWLIEFDRLKKSRRK